MKKLLSLLTVVCLLIPVLAAGSDIQTRRSPLYPYQSSIFLQDEFATGVASSGQVGSLGWTTAAGSLSIASSADNRVGVYTLGTGASQGTAARINPATSSIIPAAHPQYVMWKVKPNHNDANVTFRMGAGNAVNASPPNEGIYLEKLDADTNFFCVTRASSTETRTDSGVAFNTNENTFAYNRNSTGVTFSLNGASVCGTHTTNLTASAISPFVFLINSAAANKTMDIDYFEMRITGIVR